MTKQPKRRRKRKRALRETLPTWEVDTLIPLWLVLAILAAATSEVWTIGAGVLEVYGVHVGWAIALTIASSQAMASMMTARALTHNAAARTVTKVAAWPSAIKLVAGALDRRLPQRRVIDIERSDPRLSLSAPLAISIGAGLASAVVSWALYDQLSPDQGLLNFILAVIAPAGSLAAALLNGVFAYGEQAAADRPAKSSARTKSDRARTGKRAPVKQKAPPPPLPSRSPATDPTLALHLETLSAAASNGRLDGQPFDRRQAEEIIERSATWTKQVIRYGLDTGQLEKAPGPGYRYKFINN